MGAVQCPLLVQTHGGAVRGAISVRLCRGRSVCVWSGKGGAYRLSDALKIVQTELFPRRPQKKVHLQRAAYITRAQS
jgi:hypothetical protein